ncbi:unnamed protein product [Cochlearia groenlandica]
MFMELFSRASCNCETLVLISPPLQYINFVSASFFVSTCRVTLFQTYHGGRVAVSASVQHGDSNPSSNSSQSNHEEHISLARNSISGFLQQEAGLSKADSDFVSENSPKKGDGGKVAFLESLGLSLSCSMYLSHYVSSSESLTKLVYKVKYLKDIFFPGSDEKGLVRKDALSLKTIIISLF